MKYLLALALVAVASGATLPEPLHLVEPQAPVVSAPELLQPVQIADITPLMVPQEVMDEVALMVKFVDTAENVEAPENFAVNVVDSPVDASDNTVNFVDEAVNDVPIQIRFMDPLPDSVVMPLVHIIYGFEVAQPDASDDFAVKFVDVADVDEETPVYMPMARAAIEPSAVKIVDSPQEASDDFKVNFVDVAEEAASYVPLALPADIEAEMVAPQEASDADLKVHFVDVAEEAASYVPLALPSDIQAVKFVDSPQEASDDFKVNFVDFAEETPSYIPQPLDMEAVKIVDSLPEENDFAVKIVDVAEQHFPKQYPDPRWR